MDATYPLLSSGANLFNRFVQPGLIGQFFDKPTRGQSTRGQQIFTNRGTTTIYY